MQLASYFVLYNVYGRSAGSRSGLV